MSNPTPPQVRQCLNPLDPQYGCVAVQAAVPGFAWGVFNPASGGHWEHGDEAVTDWQILTAAGS